MIEIKDECERPCSVQIVCERGISLITGIILFILFIFFYDVYVNINCSSKSFSSCIKII